jgi:hypothetical protein
MDFAENWRETLAESRRFLGEAQKRVAISQWGVAQAEEFLKQTAIRLDAIEAAGELHDKALRDRG